MTRGTTTIAAVLCLALALALGGCGVDAGDGDLVDDWAPVAEAKPVVPQPGRCYNGANTYASAIDVVTAFAFDCAKAHTVETFHVGQFPDTVTVLPDLGTIEYQRAYDECEVKAKEFLGAEWVDGWVHLGITVPLPRQWRAGHRWYRCELIQIENQLEKVVSRTGSLRGSLGGPTGAVQRCVTATGMTEAGWDDLVPIDCATPHDAEYVGSYEVPGLNAPSASARDSVADQCWDVVARYAGATRSGLRLGYLSWGASEERWKRGDHRIRCYGWAGPGRKMRGTVLGLGNRTPPS